MMMGRERHNRSSLRAQRSNPYGIANYAPIIKHRMDCFVALLLAMTKKARRHSVGTNAVSSHKRNLCKIPVCTGMTLMLMLFAILPAHAQSCTTPPTNGLVGYWTLDETSGTTVADSSGNGNNGTVQGGLDLSADNINGMIANAKTFGGGKRLEVPYSASLGQPSSAITVAAWIYLTSNSSLGRVVWKADTGSGHDFTLWVRSDNNASFDFDTTSGFISEVAFEPDMQLNKWYHIAATYDGADVIIYVNGSEASRDTHTGTIIDSGNELSIGARPTTGNHPFPGHIDDVRIYNRALSAEEIAQLYEYGFGDEGTLVFDNRHLSLKYCNGTEWVHAGTGPYNPNGVFFDNTTYLEMTGPLSGVADTKRVTMSFWAYMTAGSNGAFDSDGLDYRLNMGAGDPQLRLYNSSDALILDLYSWDDLFSVQDEWAHFLFSADLENLEFTWYMNDVPLTPDGGTGSATAVNDFIDAASLSSIFVGCTSGYGGSIPAVNCSTPFESGLADFWLDFGTYIDFSIEENRRKFRSALGAPMYLGPDGSIPTGSSPDIFLSGQTDDWHTNKGTGGGFTENGTLTYSSSRPIANNAGTGDITIGWNGGSSNQLAYVAAAFEASSCTPSINNAIWNSTATNPASSYTLSSYTVPSVTDGMLIVAIATEDDNTSSEGVPTGVTFGGTPLTEAVTVTQANDKTASIYYLGNPSASTGDIVVNTTGNVEAIQLGAYVVNCVINQAPVATQTDANNTANVSVTFTGLPSNYIIVDSFEHGGSAAATMSITGTPGFTEIFTQDTNTGATSSQAAGYFVATNSSALGSVRYNHDFNVMEYYSGTEWVAMGPIGGTPPTNGLVGHWTMDETSGTTIADSSGNAYTGTMQGSMDAGNDSVTGLLSTALDFDGVDDHIDLGNSTLEVGASDSLTISLWQRSTQDADNALVMNKQNGNASEAGYSLRYRPAAGTGRLMFLNSDGTNQVESHADMYEINDGVWHHIVAIIDRGTNTQRLYVDGVVKDSDDISAVGDMSNTHALLFGEDGVNYYDGVMDDIRFYNRALTLQEIRQLYHYGLSNGLGDINNGCASPAGEEGEMFYNADFNVMQYCNGEEWIGMGQ